MVDMNTRPEVLWVTRIAMNPTSRKLAIGTNANGLCVKNVKNNKLAAIKIDCLQTIDTLKLRMMAAAIPYATNWSDADPITVEFPSVGPLVCTREASQSVRAIVSE